MLKTASLLAWFKKRSIFFPPIFAIGGGFSHSPQMLAACRKTNYVNKKIANSFLSFDWVNFLETTWWFTNYANRIGGNFPAQTIKRVSPSPEQNDCSVIIANRSFNNE